MSACSFISTQFSNAARIREFLEDSQRALEARITARIRARIRAQAPSFQRVEHGARGSQSTSHGLHLLLPKTVFLHDPRRPTSKSHVPVLFFLRIRIEQEQHIPETCLPSLYFKAISVSNRKGLRVGLGCAQNGTDRTGRTRTGRDGRDRTDRPDVRARAEGTDRT